MRPRTWIVAGVLIVIPLGLFIRQLPGMLGDLGGGALFTVLVGMIVLLVTPTTRPAAAGVVAFVVSAAVELVQASGVPAAISAVFPPAQWVLGNAFAASDFAGYAVGGALVAVIAARGARIQA